MNQPVIVIGGGGHARVLIDILKLRSINILGITENDYEKYGRVVMGVPIIGSDEEIFRHNPSSVLLVNGLGSINVPKVRQRVFLGFKEKGYSFVNLLHPSAVIASNVVLGEGVQVMAGTVVQTGVQLGVNSIVNTRASVDHDCVIGDHVHLAPGVTLSGEVKVGAGTHIGSGATVIQGIHIGDETLIGAGSLVLKDILARATAFGVPAKVVDR